MKLTTQTSQNDNFLFENGLIRELRYILINCSIEDFCSNNEFKILPFQRKKIHFILNIKKEIDLKKLKNKKYEDLETEHLYWETLFDNDLDKFRFDKRKNNCNFYKQSFSVGKPDYFMYNENEYFFVEFKTIRDNLRPSQLTWFTKNLNIPLLIIHSLKDNTKHG